MPEHVARKDMTVQGERIRAGEPVPMQKLSRDLQRKLIDTNKVVPHRVTVRTGGD